MPSTPSAAVLVPVKAFAAAKVRLAPALAAPDRAALAQTMAEAVVAAAAPLPVAVACDDQGVAAWAEALGAAVIWSPRAGLNGAVQRGFAALGSEGFEVVVVSHADLPHARHLDRTLGFDGVTLVPDRRDDGTNVIAVPTASSFRFAYGPSSFARHLAEAARVGCRVRVLRLPDLQWDVDTPDDLPLPAAT